MMPIVVAAVFMTIVPSFAGELPPATRAPNIVFILTDDMGYGELGCYGQKLIQTPRLDRMAGEGMRFTQFYAGATVCAPSRSVLMTGQHHGHTRVRGNAGPKNPLAQALRYGDVTVAGVLKGAGYTTALVGKWGLGDVGPASTGLPRKHGFDQFYGYLNQVHAHNHFPSFLWRNETKESLPNEVIAVGETGAGYATKAVAYADDRFAEEALKIVTARRAGPFFLFWSMVVPHANNERTRFLKDGAEVPDYGPYADKDWPTPTKGHAAMITRLDGYVGRMLDDLRREGLAENTLVLFSSDNGPHKESGHDAAFFQPQGPLRGYKRDLYDGGIRVPLIAWWPGKIRPAAVTRQVGYFGDLMATAAELAAAPLPPGTDSVSLVPTLLGRPGQQQHEFLYWEFHERGFSQAALYQGHWKGIRLQRPNAALELYDLARDPGEAENVAASHPEIVAVIDRYLRSARTESEDWPVKGK